MGLQNKLERELCRMWSESDTQMIMAVVDEELGKVADKIREMFTEDILNKMDKEQDKRLKAKKSVYFPYYVVEVWLNDLQKEVLGLLVEQKKENQRK